MITPRQRTQLRLPLLVAGVFLGAVLALLMTGHPVAAVVALVAAVAIALGVLADIIISGGR